MLHGGGRNSRIDEQTFVQHRMLVGTTEAIQ